MKCPKKGCTCEIVDGVCQWCGLVEDSPEYIEAVNVLLTEVAEEDEDAEVGW